MKFLKDWFTEPDNVTYCLVKAIAASGSVVFFVCSIIHVVNNKQFDFTSFGVGLGSIMTGAGAGMFMKKDTK